MVFFAMLRVCTHVLVCMLSWFLCACAWCDATRQQRGAVCTSFTIAYRVLVCSAGCQQIHGLHGTPPRESESRNERKPLPGRNYVFDSIRTQEFYFSHLDQGAKGGLVHFVVIVERQIVLTGDAPHAVRQMLEGEVD